MTFIKFLLELSEIIQDSDQNKARRTLRGTRHFERGSLLSSLSNDFNRVNVVLIRGQSRSHST